MATLRDIKTRIRIVGNIQKITRAMQLVAAAKLTRAQQRAQTVRPYADELNKVLGTLARLVTSDTEDETPMTISFYADKRTLETTREKLFRRGEAQRPAVVLITSDRGLCGSFNTNLIRAAQNFMSEHPGARLITLGKKARGFFKTRKIEPVLHMEGISDKLPLAQTKEIASRLVEMFVKNEVDAVHMVYAKHRKGTSYRVTRQQLLPIPPVEGGEGEDVYILEPSRDRVFEALVPLYVTTGVLSALADSFASEHGARMTAMQQATQNAEDKINDLVIQRNRMRQAAITKELSEIVGGAEALR